LGDDLDGFDQLLRRGVLKKEAACPAAERLEDVLVALEGGQDQDPGLVIGRLLEDAAGRLQPVHDRHLDVHQDDIRPQRAGGGHGGGAVLGFTGDLDAVLALEDHAEADPNHRLIVDQQHAEGHVGASRSGR
jgi:hypothetical protein